MSYAEDIERAQRMHRPVRHLRVAHTAETTAQLAAENDLVEEVGQAVHTLTSVTDSLMRATLDDTKRALLRDERAHVFAALERLQLVATAIRS